MKKYFALAAIGCLLTAISFAQPKSPPDSVRATLKNGTTIFIKYSKPSLRGRTIGKDVEPMAGQVWRMGANKATLFEVNKEVKIEGKTLPAGKYSLFGIQGEKDFTLIFNKDWDTWGIPYDPHKDHDALRVDVKPRAAKEPLETLAYTIDKDGKVTMQWGTLAVDFKVK